MAVMTSVISGSVGLAGANRKADVQLIQGLLNAVPFAKGGPNPLLGVDGLCGPKTCGAISRFQSTNLKFADGRIDVDGRTIEFLLSLLESLGLLGQALPGYPGGSSPSAPGPVPVPLPTPIPGTTPSVPGLSALRAEIKKWAEIGAKGPYGDVSGGAANGIVSDLDTITEVLSWGGSRRIRKGWKNYKEFFDVAVTGWTENHWKAPGYLDGVKVPGKRVPRTPGKPEGLSWCGIFATWCWIKAGKSTKWTPGVGPTNATKVAANKDIQVGDMCVQYGGEVHHFLPIEINGEDIVGVNGNSNWQSILVKPMKRASINYYYRPE